MCVLVLYARRTFQPRLLNAVQPQSGFQVFGLKLLVLSPVIHTLTHTHTPHHIYLVAHTHSRESLPCVQLCWSHCPTALRWELSEKCFTVKRKKMLIRFTECGHTHGPACRHSDIISHHRASGASPGRPGSAGRRPLRPSVPDGPRCWPCGGGNAVG